jgi:cytidyltransferase-like protein
MEDFVENQGHNKAHESKNETFIRSRDKLVDYETARETIRRLRGEGKSVTYVDGVFDVVHTGHLEYLELAKMRGDVLVVGIKPDATVRNAKGPERPFRGQNERQALIAGFGSVDYATILPEFDPASSWRARMLAELSPTEYAVMTDDPAIAEKKAAVDTVPQTDLAILNGNPKTHSTTGIVQRIRGQNE